MIRELILFRPSFSLLLLLSFSPFCTYKPTFQIHPSGTGTENYDYTFISGFSIEGKWKSVGDSGFGQAQPGTIVGFDGTNCNFFSPKDTYAIYQDGDTYKLDVTSYLFADTLTFTVNTIDEDHIVITSGQTVTELERVE